ncbi:hypothetical protein [Hydrocarboniphaga effusa]|uniref:hypothetical protein n=1 Tax=Hydrocarboniphaga effusa TaxID=243629 RepID=UPI003BAD70EC
MPNPTAAPLAPQSMAPADRIQANVMRLCTAIRFTTNGELLDALSELEEARFSIGIAISDLEREVRHAG